MKRYNRLKLICIKALPTNLKPECFEVIVDSKNREEAIKEYNRRGYQVLVI